jgi:hypothetical protein
MLFEGTGGQLGTIVLLPFTGEGLDALVERAWALQESISSPLILEFRSLMTS